MFYIFLKLLVARTLETLDYIRKFVLWRLQNKHNSTVIYTRFSFNEISVGKHTYGRIGVQRYNSAGEGLKIGNYVSIADNVLFILGGNHSMNTITSFPFKSFYKLNADLDMQTKGMITVDDEVWIGNNVLILSGVHIGKGAIIAAGSVVSKDIPAYTIVGGNPAKVIRTRYSDNIVSKLMENDLSSYSDSVLKSKIDLLYQPLNDENIDDILLNLKS